jgi:hypothetical protein
MSGITVAVTTYIIAIVISFFVAGLIQIMSFIMTRYAKDNVTLNEAVTEAQSGSDDAAIAAVIAIAKNQA